MPSAPLSSPVQENVGEPTAQPLETGTPPSAAIDMAGAALAAYVGQPASGAAWNAFALSIQQAAVAVSAIQRGSTAANDGRFDGLLGLLRELIASGVHSRLDAEAVGPVPVAKGWPGFAATMLLRPAWSVPQLPDLDRIPDWLVKRWTEWLFAVPQSFEGAGQTEVYAAHCERQLARLVGWVEANPGAASVQTAVESFRSRGVDPCLVLSSSDLRRHAELRARLVARLDRQKIDLLTPAPIGREGRRLRVGFVVPEFDGGTEVRATIPLLTNLDPERFESEVFVFQSNDSHWEKAARQAAVQLQTLPESAAESAQAIAGSMLDVLVFCGNAQRDDRLARLMTLRLAPLQAAAGAHQAWTTGCAGIDLFVTGGLSGAAEDAPQFSERLALLAGPARTFDFVTAPEPPAHPLTRDDVGIPAGMPVFVAAADWSQVTPQVRASWARILAASPGSYFLLQRTGTEPVDADAIARHCAAFDRALANAGVADNRLIILSEVPASQAGMEAVIALGDIYLDQPGVSDDATALAALSVGVPVVTLPGATMRSRRVAALLRSIGCLEPIARNPGEYEAMAVGLACLDGERAELAQRIRSSMAALPWPADGLAAGDAFGDVLEMAFDERIAVGERAFRSNRAPLRIQPDPVPADEHLRAGREALTQGDTFTAAARARLVLRTKPTHTAARALLGGALLALGQPGRAASYLLATVEKSGTDAAIWFSLAQALQQNGQTPQAVQALQASLRLDAKRPESWLMLIDLAEAAGVLDLARDAFGELKQVAPTHPEISALALRLGEPAGGSPGF